MKLMGISRGSLETAAFSERARGPGVASRHDEFEAVHLFSHPFSLFQLSQ